METNKIAIFGGTFDPIHIGHINIANECINQLKLDYLFFTPAGIPYHKKIQNVTSSKIRLQMCKLCCTLNPKFKTSDIDIKRKHNTYSYDTVKEFKKIYTQSEIWMLIGSDSLENLHNWYNFLEIQKFTNFIIAPRNNFNINNLNQKILLLINTSNCIFLNSKIYNISSSEIRNMIKSNKNINDFVPNIIVDYIYNNNLYKT